MKKLIKRPLLVMLALICLQACSFDPASKKEGESEMTNQSLESIIEKISKEENIDKKILDKKTPDEIRDYLKEKNIDPDQYFGPESHSDEKKNKKDEVQDPRLQVPKPETSVPTPVEGEKSDR